MNIAFIGRGTSIALGRVKGLSKLKVARHCEEASDEAIWMGKKGRIFFATDGIAFITIPDCFNFILYFLREENYRNDGLFLGFWG